MKINVNTKYDAGQFVYVIYEGDRYNDYYSNETIWKVMTDNIYQNNIIPFEVLDVIVHQGVGNTRISYEFKNIITTDDDIFDTKELAINECKQRNN